MRYACAPIVVGVVSPVSEIQLLSKTAKFPFSTMDYSPWSSKNLVDQNWLKKFMLIGIDVKCRHTSFGGCGSSCFGDIAFKIGQIFLLDHGLSPRSSKNLINWHRLKKFMQVGVDVLCMHTNFCVWPLRFQRYCYFQKQRYCYFQIFGQISLSDHGLHGGQKFIY